ncbi:MAG: chemotaxis protein CheW, partial [Nitrospirae bacterium]|nr:chemotaxis protein CheW [Nitrospirota bacterium]
MATTPYLIFSLHDLRYAVKAVFVTEIHPLPELTPVEEVSPFVAGVIDLRGKIIPVVDLSVRFGHPSCPIRLSDHLVVMETREGLVGMVVHQ